MSYSISEYTINGHTYRNLEAQVLKNACDIKELKESGGGGAGVEIVTTDNTFAEVKALYDAGKSIALKYELTESGEAIVPLTAHYEEDVGEAFAFSAFIATIGIHALLTIDAGWEVDAKEIIRNEPGSGTQDTTYSTNVLNDVLEEVEGNFSTILDKLDDVDDELQLLDQNKEAAFFKGTGLQLSGNTLSVKIDNSTIITNDLGQLEAVGGGGGSQVQVISTDLSVVTSQSESATSLWNLIKYDIATEHKVPIIKDTGVDSMHLGGDYYMLSSTRWTGSSAGDIADAVFTCMMPEQGDQIKVFSIDKYIDVSKYSKFVVPVPSVSDAGKVLKVNAQGTLEWATP